MLATEIIRRVKQIQIRTGRSVADVLAGEYASVFRGAGIEFDEVRPYVAGDDVRTIDWNVTARAGAPFVKRYVEERQLTLMLMADISASQDFGSVSRSKREATAELCALLAFTAIQSDDKVGLVLFHSEVEQFIPPRKGQKHALRVVREVLAHGTPMAAENAVPKPGTRMRQLWSDVWPRRLQRRLRPARQATDIAAAMQFLMSVSKRKTLCFVVSDFIDQGFERALSMGNRRHDVVAVLVTDPRESELPSVGLTALQDAETGATAIYDLSSKSVRTSLASASASRIEALERGLRRRGMDFIHIDASTSVVDPLIAFFRMREKRIRR